MSRARDAARMVWDSMARLKEFRSGLSSAPATVRRLTLSATGKRAKVQPGSHLYNSAKWKRLVAKIRVRDRMICQATGALLIGKYPDALSPVVDHKTPHGGDEALFWDEENLWLVSKGWHDSQKQSQDKRRFA